MKKNKKDPLKKEMIETDKLQSELEQMTELAKRTMADLQNLKRRQEQERSTMVIFANAELIRSLLPIIDNLQRAIKLNPLNSEQTDDATGNNEKILSSIKEWSKGIEMSINQLKKLLQETGLEEIKTVNEPFNPDLHEAVAQDKGEKDIILEEYEKGYKLCDRVLRHAKVKVGNGEKPETSAG